MGKQKVNIYKISKSSKQVERIDEGLKLLGLDGMGTSFDKLAQLMIKDNTTPYDFLESLLEKELLGKEDGRISRWIKQAKFPAIKTLESFDFSFQPTIDKRQIYELSSCRFIDKAENVVFFGPPGVGKTHLAIALGMEAIYKGYEVRFLELDKLIDAFERVSDDAQRQRWFLSSLVRPKLLIIDEMDLYETTAETSGFLFKLLKGRYEKGSMILTSNRTFEAWDKIFGSKSKASVIVDRSIHYSTIINIDGDSYRLKDKLKKQIGF